MRRRLHHQRVCSCSPAAFYYLDADMLRSIVNREIHPIRCAASCSRKALKALVLGDLCAETHHPEWALRVWLFAIDLIHNKDYDDWIGVWFNPAYVSLNDVISDGLCEMLGRRIDDLYRRYGLADPKGMDSWEYKAGDGWYDSFKQEKYDYYWPLLRQYWIDLRNEAIAAQLTDDIFLCGQSDYTAQPQDFFCYWSDENQNKLDLYFKVDDWDN